MLKSRDLKRENEEIWRHTVQKKDGNRKVETEEIQENLGYW